MDYIGEAERRIAEELEEQKVREICFIIKEIKNLRKKKFEKMKEIDNLEKEIEEIKRFDSISDIENLKNEKMFGKPTEIRGFEPAEDPSIERLSPF